MEAESREIKRRCVVSARIGRRKQLQNMFKWREVSVDGDIYTLRTTRASAVRGDHVRNECNQLEVKFVTFKSRTEVLQSQDGTLIDLCGATLLYRSPAGIEGAPTRHDLDELLSRLNGSKPQCPVNLMTLG